MAGKIQVINGLSRPTVLRIPGSEDKFIYKKVRGNTPASDESNQNVSTDLKKSTICRAQDKHAERTKASYI